MLDYSDLYDGFLYLDELKEGGSVNMLKATTPLSKHLGIGKMQALRILNLWIKTYSEDEDLDDRVDSALELVSNE